MTLRAPRRRISPRTKHRYRVIREFFRRALGSSSQQDIKINSSIAINVTDLKHKIVGLENQLDEVTKQCRDIIYLESSSRKESASDIPTEHHRDIDTIKERTEESDVKSNDLHTKLLYKTSESHYRESDVGEYVQKSYQSNGNIKNNNNMNPESYDSHVSIVGKKRLSKNRTKIFEGNDYKNKTKSVCDNFDSAYYTSSFHSLYAPQISELNDAGNSGRHREKRHLRREHFDLMQLNQKNRRDGNNADRLLRNCKVNHGRTHRNKHTRRDLDQDFITDIIRKQYKPIKMFGRKESGVSQFSAPICRDQEFSINENIQEGTELCSCCYEGYNNSNLMRCHGISDRRSVCNIRLHNSKRHSRSKHRKKHVDIYNNSDLYDLVPVKEKASPKSRRKFAEDIITPYDYYREVPPSPRTLRPRLNLKCQNHTEIEDYMARLKRHSKKDKLKKRQQYTESVESDSTTEISQDLNVRYHKLQKQKDSAIKPNQHHVTTAMSRLQSPNLGNERTNLTVDTLNKTQDTDLSDEKTDRALCEIKDILQNFLLEIKKESTASQCHKSEESTKADEKIKGVLPNNTEINTHSIPNSEHNFNNYNVAQCSLPPYIPGFNNSCCYPIMPVCPMNCVQSGYIVPSPSFTCATCATNTYKENTKDNVPQKNKEQSQHSETDKLIKEIYKFIAQSPTVVRKQERYNENSSRKEKITTENQNICSSRSSKTSKHDAKVGTPYVKCYSKSCEAIASRMISEACYSGTNASYSDTVLEKLSLEPTTTQSTSEFDSSNSNEVNKNKGKKIGKVFRSFGIFKKKKDIIEELSESESAIDVEVKRKKPPFRQEITNYTMHGQEYFQPPPISPHSHPYQQPPCEHLHRQPYHPAYPMHPPPAHDIYHPPRMQQQPIHEHDAARHYHQQPHPSAPPFPNYENYNIPPQVPLCLKEIEVKSAGTQSERKLTLFGKIKKKMQPPGHITPRSDEYPQRNCSTQTAQTNQNKVNKPGLFNWKNLQAKVAQLDEGQDPMKFSFNTQKRLAEGDIKMRNAMLKKIFHKRNPFSPRNLIIRTLLGKDKSSFGEAPQQYRPRMFF